MNYVIKEQDFDYNMEEVGRATLEKCTNKEEAIDRCFFIGKTFAMRILERCDKVKANELQFVFERDAWLDVSSDPEKIQNIQTEYAVIIRSEDKYLTYLYVVKED